MAADQNHAGAEGGRKSITARMAGVVAGLVMSAVWAFLLVVAVALLLFCVCAMVG
jgi:hypothetical protein